MSKQKNWTGERLETMVFNETTIEHLHRYAIAIEFSANKKVLDIACGDGYGSRLLANVAESVLGVDNNTEVINEATRKYVKPNLSFLAGSVEKIPAMDHEFDIVVSFETLEHTGAHDQMMEEIKRVLKPKGILFVSTPDKKNYTDKPGTKNPFHVKELYPEEFHALLARYFKNIVILDQQIAYSSVITSREATGFKSYTGGFEQIKEEKDEHRLYCVALAADDELPAVQNSLFNGRSVFGEAADAREKNIKNTLSYKIGHVILYPAKLIRKLFK